MFQRISLITIIAVCSSMPGILFSQATLSLSTTSLSSSTPAINDQLSIFTMLTNTSATDTFEGIIDFSLANDDSILISSAVVGKPNFAGTTIKLAPQEQRAALFTVQLIPSYFKAGPEIIIVWPIATNPKTITLIVDSAEAPIDIQAAVGVNDFEPLQLKAFVSRNHFIIQNGRSEIALEQIQILSANGSIVRTQSVSSSVNVEIDIASLVPGVYLGEVLFNNGSRTVIRFVKY
jgi:hypothetical protein